MCITFFTLNPPSTTEPSPYKFIQVFNREEDFDRPTHHLAFWEEDQNILGGRDKRFGGTWLGINIKTGNFAFLTNIDRQHLPVRETKSDFLGRGKIIWDFCRSDFFMTREVPYQKDSVSTAINNYLNEIEENKHRYGGFNLVAGNLKTLQFRHIGNDKFNKGTVDVKNGAYVMTNNAFAEGFKPAQNTLKKFGEIVTMSMSEKTKSDEFVDRLEVIAEEGFKFPYTWFEEFTFEKGKQLELIKTAIWATKTSTFILFDNQNNLKVVEATYDEDLKMTGKVLHEVHIEPDL